MDCFKEFLENKFLIDNNDYMKVAIIFASKHGTTEKVANLLADKLRRKGDDVSLHNLRRGISPDLKLFDKVIIGGSIHAGNIQRGLVNFCEKNKEVLKDNKLGLFICCMHKEKAQEQFDNAYCEDLRNHSSANSIMGGEFIFEKMNFIERILVKKIAKVKGSVSDINTKEISRFADEV